MSVIKRMRRQRAIYWEKLTPDHHGRNRYAEPVEIACRWEEGTSDFRTAGGTALMFTATIYVDRPMKIGDKLKRGTLESDTPSNPDEVDKAYTIQRYSEIPNLRNTETLLTAYV